MSRSTGLLILPALPQASSHLYLVLRFFQEVIRILVNFCTNMIDEIGTMNTKKITLIFRSF